MRWYDPTLNYSPDRSGSTGLSAIFIPGQNARPALAVAPADLVTPTRSVSEDFTPTRSVSEGRTVASLTLRVGVGRPAGAEPGAP